MPSLETQVNTLEEDKKALNCSKQDEVKSKTMEIKNNATAVKADC